MVTIIVLETTAQERLIPIRIIIVIMMGVIITLIPMGARIILELKEEGERSILLPLVGRLDPVALVPVELRGRSKSL